MTVRPFSASNLIPQRNSDLFVDMRSRLDDLQRQLATGRKAETYSALGIERRISLDARGKMSAAEGWIKGIEQGDLRIKFMMQTIEGFSKQTLEAKSDARPGGFVVSANGTVAGQVLATSRLQAAIDMLNTDVDGRYLFSGRSHDVKPVEGFDMIMNGDGVSRDGVRTMISERRQADAGVGNLGRLTNTLAGTTVTVAREVANPPYGFVIAGATSASPAIAASVTAGPPASAAFNVTGTPLAGESVSLTLDLPDGTRETITLEARAPGSTGPAELGFTIGATPAATAANLQASVTAALQKETATSLDAASSIIAARNFFAGSNGNPPLRVPGPPFNTATAPPAPAAPNTTVIWYRGDDSAAISARNTALLQIDDRQVAPTGARANEEAFQEGLAQLAAFASGSFPSTDPNARDRYEALADRVRTGLAFTNKQKPQDIAVEIGASQSSMAAAKERHRTAMNLLETARANVEDANKEEVAASLLALQTRLQAAYQTTSILSRLNLANFIS